LLSRYVGAYGVDTHLFGTVLRTYMSSEGITWTPDNICVFDGLEHVRTLCTEWYSQRVASSPGAQPHVPDNPERELDLLISPNDPDNLVSPMAELSIFVADAIVDRKSVFVGRSCPISHPSQVSCPIARRTRGGF